MRVRGWGRSGRAARQGSLAYRLNRILLTFFGPPQLDKHNDPLERLAREQEERRRRAARQAED